MPSLIALRVPQRWLLVVAALSLLFAPLLRANEYALPDMGDPSGAQISPAEARSIGLRIIRQIRAQGLLVTDGTINSYVRDLGYRLVAHSDRASDKFEFFVIDAPEINAFALPGGFIGINSGLITHSANESELAAVMAHEIVHVTQQHILRGADKSSRANNLTLAAMLIGLILSQGNPEIIQGIIGAGTAVATQNILNFTRAHEIEADRLGIRLLSKAGFDPVAMATFFERLWNRARLSESAVPEMLRTHPVYSTRVTEALIRAQRLPKVQVVDSSRYTNIKARLTMRRVRNQEKLLEIYEREVKQALPSEKDQARYRYALALSNASRHKEAEKILASLVKKDEANAQFWLSLAETQMKAKRDQRALKSYRKAIRLFPGDREITQSYAVSLLQMGRPTAAKKLLLRATAYDRTTYPPYYGLLARAATESKSVAEGHFYMGEYLLINGRIPQAIEQLELAIEDSKLAESHRLRAKAHLQEVKRRYPKIPNSTVESEKAPKG